MSPKLRSQPSPDFVEGVMERFTAEFPTAVLIGGWASYLRTRADKSHDIDVIVDLETLGLLGSRFEMSSSTHVGGRNFQLEVEGVEVDVYPTFQSRLGALLHIPVEALVEHSEVVGGFRTLSPEGLFVAKMAALHDRPDSLPGEKDRREIWLLLKQGAPAIDYRIVSGILSSAGWKLDDQVGLIAGTFNFLEETDVVRARDRASLRKMREVALATVLRLAADRGLEISVPTQEAPKVNYPPQRRR